MDRLKEFTNAMNQVWKRHDRTGRQSIDERDDSGNQQAKYVYGAGLDEPVRMYRSSTYYYYLSDGLGNVAEVLGASGNVVEKWRRQLEEDKREEGRGGRDNPTTPFTRP